MLNFYAGEESLSDHNMGETTIKRHNPHGGDVLPGGLPDTEK